MASPSAPAASPLAVKIVDDVLGAVEKFGRFEGRGRERALTFPLIVRRDSDETHEVRDRIIEVVDARLSDLVAALRGLLVQYVTVVNCGDCGSWDPETDLPVIAAREALKFAEGATSATDAR